MCVGFSILTKVVCLFCIFLYDDISMYTVISLRPPAYAFLLGRREKSSSLKSKHPQTGGLTKVVCLFCIFLYHALIIFEGARERGGGGGLSCDTQYE